MFTSDNGNEFTTERINDGSFQGLAILINGEIVARVEEDLGSEKVDVYVYSDMKDDEYTHKINVDNL